MDPWSGGLLYGENLFFYLRRANISAWKNRAKLFTALQVGRYFMQAYLDKAEILQYNATLMSTPNYSAF